MARGEPVEPRTIVTAHAAGWPLQKERTPRRRAGFDIAEAIRGYSGALEEDNLPVPEERFEALAIAV